MNRRLSLWPDEIPKWLVSRRMPDAVLFGSLTDLERHAAEHGHPLPTLLELDAARRRRREVREAGR